MQLSLRFVGVLTSICAVWFGADVVSAQTTGAQEVAPPIKIVGKIFAEGSGCPAGTVEQSEVVTNPGSQNVTIRFTDFVGFVGPDAFFQTLDCELRIKLQTPAGYRLALTDIIWYGFVDFPAEGMTGSLRTTYYWSGRPIVAQSDNPKEYVGPVTESFKWEEKVDVAQWSDCAVQEELVANSFLSVTTNSSGDEGEMRIKRTDVNIDSSQSVGLELRFATRRCNAPTTTTTTRR